MNQLTESTEESKPVVYYRYETSVGVNGRMGINLRTFTMARKTKQGAWIKETTSSGFCISEKLHFVLDFAYKKYAYRSKDDAYNSFRIRQRRRLSHALNNLEHAIAAQELTDVNECDRCAASAIIPDMELEKYNIIQKSNESVN